MIIKKERGVYLSYDLYNSLKNIVNLNIEDSSCMFSKKVFKIVADKAKRRNVASVEGAERNKCLQLKTDSLSLATNQINYT